MSGWRYILDSPRRNSDDCRVPKCPTTLSVGFISICSEKSKYILNLTNKCKALKKQNPPKSL